LTEKTSKNVLTLVGPDRPGIVRTVSGILSENGFNIEDSRMAVLGGEFAMIVLVSGPKPVSDLISDMEKESGLMIRCRETGEDEGLKPGVPYLVYGYAMDHPGIVHALAREVAAFGANIEEMETSTEPAPVTGTPLFDVRMRVSLPPEVSVKEVRKRLEEIGEMQNIDISVEPFSH